MNRLRKGFTVRYYLFAKRNKFISRILKCFLGTILGITVVMIICYGLMKLSHWYAINEFTVPKNNQDSKEALFGDSFGSVNAIISALAFIGVVVALWMQQRQIQLQREDLALQRQDLRNNTKELERQSNEFEEQNRNIRLQRFENTFFQMLSLHHEIVAGLKVNIKLSLGSGLISDYTTVTGREVFNILYTKAYIGDRKNQNDAGIKDVIENFKLRGYRRINEISTFDHYFRNLYRIIKFVDSIPERRDEKDKEGILTLKEKKEYIAIVRASISEYELVLLFFNCLYMKDFIQEPQFKKFVEKYHLFNNIRPEKIGKDLFEEFGEEYDASAFNW